MIFATETRVVRRFRGWRRALGVLSAGTIMVTISSVVATPIASASAKTPITIGVITPDSGVYAVFGQNEKQAVQIFAKYQKEWGGRPLKFIYLNDNSDPTQSAADARQLAANPKVMGIIGGTVTALMVAEYPILAAAKIPTYFLSPNPYPNFNHTPFIYGPDVGGGTQLNDLLAASVSYFHIKKSQIAIAVNNDASGQANSTAFQSAGYTNISQFPATLTDFGPYIAQMKAAGIKMLYVNSDSGSQTYIRQAQVAAGWDIPFFAGPSSFNTSFITTVGKQANGVYTAVPPGSVSNPSLLKPKSLAKNVARAQREYRKYGGNAILGNIAQGQISFDGALSFAFAAKGLNNLTRPRLNSKMENQRFVGVEAVVHRSTSAGNASGLNGPGYVLARYVNGKTRLVKQFAP